MPPDTVKAIIGQMLLPLLASETGDFQMDVMQTGAWVRPMLDHKST